MPRRAQMDCDGIPVAKVKGRLAGTVELEKEEAQSSLLDDVGIAVVAYRVEAPTFKVNKDGDLERTNVYGVTELRIPDADLREALIERLGLYVEGTLFSPPPPAPVSSATPDQAPDGDEPVGANVATSQERPAVTLGEAIDGMTEPDDETEPTIHVPAPANRGDGPKVARFTLDDEDEDQAQAAPIDREVVGSVYQRRRDPALAGFLSGDE